MSDVCPKEQTIRDYIDESVRLAVAQALQPVQERLDVGGRRMDRIESQIEKNAKMTEEVIEILHAAKAGLKAIGWLGGAAKWIVSFGAAVAAIWVTFKK